MDTRVKGFSAVELLVVTALALALAGALAVVVTSSPDRLAGDGRSCRAWVEEQLAGAERRDSPLRITWLPPQRSAPRGALVTLAGRWEPRYATLWADRSHWLFQPVVHTCSPAARWTLSAGSRLATVTLSGRGAVTLSLSPAP